MGNFEDLTGKKFGLLTVTQRAQNRGHNTYWLCKCACGKYKEVQASNLKTGACISCGCTRRVKLKKIFTKHDKTNTRLYSIWSGMKQRCLNSTLAEYKYYGGRGVTVCDDWKNDFMKFYSWSINNGYKKNLSIDRIDVNGDYTPDNCRWITNNEQQVNRRNNRYLKFEGQKLCVAEWARLKGLKEQTLYKRLDRGWTVHRALTTP